MNLKKIRQAAFHTLLAGILTANSLEICLGQSASKEAPPRKIARLIWQDNETQSIRWGDLERTDLTWSLKPQGIANAPTLDPEHQQFSQMQRLGQSLIVGVRDDQDGTLGSGWIAVDSGVTLEEHGDHFHAHYDAPASIAGMQLDSDQGNPAHVYRIGNRVFLANDAKQGFTILGACSADAPETNPSATNLAAINQPISYSAKFHSGGGSHITLAAFEDRYCFATWPDRQGDHAGRVDIVSIDAKNSDPIASFKVKSGGLHGATSNAKRIFFAPSDGVDWIDTGNWKPGSEPIVEHIDLGKDPESDKPNRTGAFENHLHYVLFAYGAGANSNIGMLDARSKSMTLESLPLDSTEGLALSTPVAFVAGNDKHYAWVVHHRRGSTNEEKLTSIELDPNGDGRFDDARVYKQLAIGASKISNHSGMHGIALLADRRTACISMPGDSEIWIVSVYGMEVLAKLKVDGTPTKIEAFGAGPDR